ncbi:MAG: hypothetical protein D8H92_12900, partial [Campylobacter sp.]
ALHVCDVGAVFRRGDFGLNLNAERVKFTSAPQQSPLAQKRFVRVLLILQSTCLSHSKASAASSLNENVHSISLSA